MIPHESALEDVVFFDIETAPLPWEEVEHLAPKECTEVLDPIQITHAMRDAQMQKLAKQHPNPRAGTIEKKMAAWEEGIAKKNEERLSGHASQEAREKWMSDCQSDASRSYVTAIAVGGWEDSKVVYRIERDQERDAMYELLRIIKRKTIACGFNIKKFDIPYLAKRAMVTGWSACSWLSLFDGRYPSGKFYDLIEAWSLGLQRHESWPADVAGSKNSQDYVCKCLGLPTKPGNGRDFYTYDDDRREEYCNHDLEILRCLAGRFYGKAYDYAENDLLEAI